MLSRIDHLNSLLCGLPSTTIDRIQRIQNICARIVTRCGYRDHITPILKGLHWLPVHLRIVYKVCLLTFRALREGQPKYLADLLEVKRSDHNLRSSSDTLLLKVPFTRTKIYGDRSFAATAPKLWNILPKNVRHSENINTFKRALKTHLFASYYDNL